MLGKQKKSVDNLQSDLEAVVGVDFVHSGNAAKHLYSKDGSSIRGGQPGFVCLPASAEEVAACIKVAVKHDRAFVPRGAGTGLAGGAVPCDDPVVISTARMTKILEVDLDRRIAWVQPGVINLDLTRYLRGTGFHFAPDPSSQQSCTIGGNVANNSGGPHCLAYGVTSAHVAAVEVALPNGELVVLGEEQGDPFGYDLRGAFVGGEGTLGLATRIAVRLTRDPPIVQTLLLDFASVEEAAQTVSAVIAAGIVPAAMELMDQKVVQAVEPYARAGYPLDAAAVLIVELDGLLGGVSRETKKISEIARIHGTRSVRIAADKEERDRIWKGRKGAFGAIAKIKPSYYLHDTVIPRTRLAEVISGVTDIAEKHGLIVMNVFHAGDGNLHPLLVFDHREPGVMEAVYSAGEEIVRLSIEVGGVLSGEHGIGLEKRAFMPLLFSPNDLRAQRTLRDAFDPQGISNPHKVLPTGASCGDLQGLPEMPDGAWI